MKASYSFLMFLILGMQGNTSLASAQEKTKDLYCTGSSYNSQILSGEFPTNALVRVAANSTYIEINSVGYGATKGKLEMASSMEGIGVFKMQSAAKGLPALDAGFSLNIYSGQLVVYPTTQNQGKVFFTGSCKETKPIL